MDKYIEKFGIKIPAITAEEINEQIKPVLREMEKAGIKIDCASLNELNNKLAKKLTKIEADIFKLAGYEFNLGSPSQMADFLFVKLKLPVDGIKRGKTGISTAAPELAKIVDAHPVIPLILAQRELSKLLTTYLGPLPKLVDENQRLHTTYGLETATGRLTSSNPNLQNIPIKGEYGQEIRKAFIAAPGYKLIAVDYSQIELRVVASIADDKAMIEAFNTGVDIHTRTAAEIFGIKQEEVTPDHRRIAKVVNFGIIYGVSPYGLSRQTGLEVPVAAEYIMKYFHNHPGIKKYMEETIQFAHKNGYVETLFGAKRYLPNINSHIHFKAEADERMAINTPIQGTAAEMLKLAMIELDRKLADLSGQQSAASSQQKKLQQTANCQLPTARLLLTVHDELVVEAPEAAVEEVIAIVKDVMENIIKLPVPIEVHVGVGNNWAEAK